MITVVPEHINRQQNQKQMLKKRGMRTEKNAMSY